MRNRHVQCNTRKHGLSKREPNSRAALRAAGRSSASVSKKRRYNFTLVESPGGFDGLGPRGSRRRLALLRRELSFGRSFSGTTRMFRPTASGSAPYLLFVEEDVPGAPSPSSAYSVSMPSWGSAFPERCFGCGNIGIGLSAMTHPGRIPKGNVPVGLNSHR